MDEPATPPYLWIPGLGPDPDALRRLRERAPRPRKPMGEAWFMGGDRHYYTGLMAGAATDWALSELENALTELTSGPTSFDHLDEWSLWFDYLLPRAQERADETWHLHELLVSAVCVHCLDPALPGRDAEFRRDLLDTLGRALMAPSRWRDGRIVADRVLDPLRDYVYGWTLESGAAFSAICSLALRYLETDAVDAWIGSLLAIDDPLWRAVFVVWLDGAEPLLFEDSQPEQAAHDPMKNIAWDWCWVLRGSVPSPRLDPQARVYAFFPPANVAALAAALRRRLGLDALSQWSDALRAACGESRDPGTALWQFETSALRVAERFGLD
ncbi:hypothetical protein GLE_3324 [Lysobacter enzymogenes]|uniref:Uncharacterized protein n=1 Tax=Lysobacter enzymogenes TaxID=69 RepID=A0A0S2DJG6_LYSEN|nr:hypothetical protein [Lysobacter enzymogenes]ALN58670.1 hypothetical protein GLE_3324 [Lysobacter enzymogenes]QCW26990.1 hypothetical protein FE772_16440 [Lysobacter enzymogenes]